MFIGPVTFLAGTRWKSTERGRDAFSSDADIANRVVLAHAPEIEHARDVLAGNAVDVSGFSPTFLKRLNATHLTARSCAGLVDAEHLEDSIMTTLLSTGSINYDKATGELYLIGPGVERNVFSDLAIALATDTCAVNANLCQAVPGACVVSCTVNQGCVTKCAPSTCAPITG